ncbi:hypothetical protein [Pseudodesulfovibrio tunisiensis]|uniref:hypothetical protein n=1 Tax=Pseudodesulfovibrio tunisiensis TaxID=463192 RepID=UPI001FB52A35|nr:hypothetical protein [Pseudodesulfovibrio tunisiensis]
MTELQMREHVFATVMDRIEKQDDAKRQEALAEYMAVTMTGGNSPEQVAGMIPPIMKELYTKWVTMFVDRLMETADRKALELLCDGTEENSAALLLTYVMFLESARMEKQVQEDLNEYGRRMTGSDDLGDAAANFLRARLAQIAGQAGGPKGNA